MSGETVWSSAARTHLMLGGQNVKATLEMLFGHGMKFPPAQLLPSRLKEFVAASGAAGVKIEPWRLLCEHTGLPYFTHYHGFKDRLETQVRILEPRGPARVRALLGLQKARGVTVRTRPAFCPRCADIEYQTLGFAFWHLIHQLPIVVVCPYHGCELREVVALTAGRPPTPFDLYLPPFGGDRVIPMSRPLPYPEKIAKKDLQLLASTAVSLLGTPHRSAELWCEETRELLRHSGYRTHGGIDYRRLVRDITSRFGNYLLDWVGLTSGDLRPVRRLLNPGRGRQQAGHYVLIDLFLRRGRPDEFGLRHS